MPTEKTQARVIDAEYIDKKAQNSSNDEKKAAAPEVKRDRSPGQWRPHRVNAKGFFITFGVLIFLGLLALYIYGSQLA